MLNKPPFHRVEIDKTGRVIGWGKDDKFQTIEEANTAAKVWFDERKAEGLMRHRTIYVYNSEGKWVSMFIDEE